MSRIDQPIGVHLSIAKGWDNIFEQAVNLDCTTIQFFIKNARQWNSKLFNQTDITSFFTAYKKTNINPLICHASYLINIVSDTLATASLSKQSLLNELMLCDQLKIPYLVLHPGSNPNQDKRQVIDYFARQVDEVLSLYQGSVMLLLENSAGQGNYLGASFEQLVDLRNYSNHKEKIGFCFDTCHAFASGYHNFDSYDDYQRLLDNLYKTIGIDQLKVIHLNDSLKKRGSCVDRHASIGHGAMPLVWFKYLMNDPLLLNIPKILETPKKTVEDDRNNLAIVRSLIE